MEVHISRLEGSKVIIRDVQDALDLIATIRYDHGCSMAVIDKEKITEDFFRLRPGLAGEILQKFTNYHFVGDRRQLRRAITPHDLISDK